MDVTSAFLKAILFPEDWPQTTRAVTHIALSQIDFWALKLFLFNVLLKEHNLQSLCEDKKGHKRLE